MKIMPFNQFKALVLGLSIVVGVSSCSEEDALEVPATYDFQRDGSSSVDYSVPTEGLDMLSRISTYIKTSNTVGAEPLDAQKLKNMFANENDPFEGRSFEQSLKDLCYPADVAMFENYMDELVVSSQEMGTASNGTAGVLVDGNPNSNTQGYRVDEKGVEHIQVIEKGLIGAIFFYQAMEWCLSTDRMGTVGNEDFIDGKNFTEMEHYADKAFGYFGVPTDFPSAATIEEVRFWGVYCNRRNNGLYPGINEEIATAFRTARAAIVAKDYDARDQAIQTIQQKWAVVIAATVVSYCRDGLSTSGEPNYIRHHALSEGIGFLMSLNYHKNGGKSKYPPHYDQSEIAQAQMKLNSNTNLYTLTDEEINDIIGHVQAAFPSGEIK